MIEKRTDFWNEFADAKCIPTNGIVKANGRAVMGAGLAKEAANRFSRIPIALGSLLKTRGNHVHIINTDYYYNGESGEGYITEYLSFPTKNHWREKSDLDLIRQSAIELMQLADEWYWGKIILPRPGCGLGGLDWQSVKPILEPILDERVVVIYK